VKNKISEVITIRKFKGLIEQQYYKPVYFLSRNKQHTYFVNEILKRIKKKKLKKQGSGSSGQRSAKKPG